jgi:NADH:ubiquinone oxidoreductase subunit
MKYLLGGCLFIFFGCNQTNHDPRSIERLPETKNIKVADNSQYYATGDHVTIQLWHGDSLVYTKAEFNSIIDNYPELVSKNTYHPDITFHGLRKKETRFSSEVGQDEYYGLYAYFLKQKNGDAVYSKRRRTLLLIYEKINELFQNIQDGGTYFGHQVSRIEGYVEYDIYQHKWYKKEQYQDEKKIAKQKALFIETLRQIIIDANLERNDIPQEYKIKRMKNMNRMVDEIANNITDLFYLRKAQRFMYTHYSYVY